MTWDEVKALTLGTAVTRWPTGWIKQVDVGMVHTPNSKDLACKVWRLA